MNNNLLKSIIVVLLLFSTLVATAQTSETNARRQCLVKSLLLLDDYEYYSALEDKEMLGGFKDLFVDGKVKLYNDLLGMSDSPTLTVDDYVNLLLKNTKQSSVILKNVKTQSVTNEGNTWRVKYTLDKEMSYNDNSGILLSSQDFYKNDYKLTVYIVYDASKDDAKIEKIEGKVDSQKHLGKDYFAVQRSKATANFDNQLLYKGSQLSYNGYDQAIIPGVYNKKDLVYKDYDVVATPVVNSKTPRLVTMNYKQRRFRVKLHYDMGLGEAFKYESSNLDNVKGKSSSFGLDFGYVFPAKSILKVGAFLGAGYTMSSIDMDYANADYHYTTTADVDGDSYERHYQNLTLTQKVKLNELTVPLYVDLDFHFSRYISFVIDLGAKFNMNMSLKKETNGSAYVYGVYSKYDNLVLDENWGYNGFGNQNYSSNNVSNELEANKFTVDLFGGAALRIQIPNTPVCIDLGANYQMGMMNLFKTAANASNSNNLVYNVISGTNSTEYVNDMISSLGNVKRKSLKLHAGLIFKF